MASAHGVGKRQVLERQKKLLAVVDFLRTPGDEARAEGLKFLHQRSGIEPIRVRAFPVEVGVEVQQAHVDGIEPIPLAEQVSVDLRLRPMNSGLVGWNAVNLAAMGLDFLHQGQTRVITVGATAYLQVCTSTSEADFGDVAVPAPSSDGLMPAQPVER